MEGDADDVTALLRAVREGVPGAADRLMSAVYRELRKIASRRVGGSGLEPTTLVHEAYLRMFGTSETPYQNRHHFFWAAARAMRDILVERAREASALKRGGGRTRMELQDRPCSTSEAEAAELISLDQALRRLETVHPQPAKVVMLRFFVGLTREEIAEQMDLSPSAVWREWNFARAWLHAEMDGDNST